MSTLEDINNAETRGMAGLVTRLARAFRPVSRRSVLLGTTVAATALATKPKDYVLRPVAAYATICGPGNTASSGWTVFCATINKGTNACPPGSFAAGWWKAADSSWCGGGYRYIVDCNAACTKCTTGCSDGICDSRCWNCSCGTGSTATCDQRRICCNAFRYGQCNTQVKCSGGVHCRVVSCVPPYRWTSCTTASLSDNRTSEHSTSLLPRWGVIEQKYRDMGAQATFLKASMGPIKSVGDGKGSYVQYQGGKIVTNPANGTRAVSWWVDEKWQAMGGPRGVMGYPASDVITGLKDSGWIQIFVNGAVTDSASTTTQVVYDIMWRVWKATGRETGTLGYPTSGVQRGLPDGGWIQTFQKGAITDSASTTTRSVAGVIYSAWWLSGRWLGPLGYPIGSVTKQSRGTSQAFQRGEIWALSGKAGYEVYGGVLTQWKAAGGATGTYGYPVTRTLRTADGGLTCTFEGGTITA